MASCNGALPAKASGPTACPPVPTANGSRPPAVSRAPGEVRLFEAATGKLDSVLTTAPDVMLDVAFDPPANAWSWAAPMDGARNRSGLPQVTRTLGLHSDWVNAVTWDHNGSRFATASRDHTAKVFDMAANKSLVTLLATASTRRGIHPDGRELFWHGQESAAMAHLHGKRVRDGFSAELFKLARRQSALCPRRRQPRAPLSDQ